ncbi:hypothetical protein V6N13_025193 [Hibiscus sabdariffa]|uniref:Uncharacterized protein n=2 Tax=Hibiscus sabdariffa TaxID=183260 RepID=A0ABR2AKU7_9ROSI
MNSRQTDTLPSDTENSINKGKHHCNFKTLRSGKQTYWTLLRSLTSNFDLGESSTTNPIMKDIVDENIEDVTPTVITHLPSFLQSKMSMQPQLSTRTYDNPSLALP